MNPFFEKNSCYTHKENFEPKIDTSKSFWIRFCWNCSWWQRFKGRWKWLFWTFRRILILPKIGELRYLLAQYHFFKNFSQNLSIRWFRNFTWCQTLKSGQMTFWILKKIPYLCSKWGKWVKCWNRRPFVTSYLFIFPAPYTSVSSTFIYEKPLTCLKFVFERTLLFTIKMTFGER